MIKNMLIILELGHQILIRVNLMKKIHMTTEEFEQQTGLKA